MSTQLTPTQTALVLEAEKAIERFVKAGLRPTVRAAICLEAFETACRESKNTRLGGVPEGHLWVAFDGPLSYDEFYLVEDLLKREGKIKVAKSHLITWIAKEGN